MTLKSIKEYAAAIRERYQKSDKTEKGKILDEFVKVTGYHRKADTRLLCKTPKTIQCHIGRPSRYNRVIEPLKAIWEASDRLCSKRLKPFLPVHKIRQNLPVTLLGVDSDNGSEFINQCFYTYCRANKITFTRSRAYKKNDNCYVEQKNGNVIRRLIGYDRYSSKVAYECLGRIYNLVRLYVNFFQPTMKLISKTRHGARVHKVYETAQTPYQRLLKSGILSQTKQTELETTYNRLNPISLLEQINGNLQQLWKLADFPKRR